jgi:hypothetical protein
MNTFITLFSLWPSRITVFLGSTFHQRPGRVNIFLRQLTPMWTSRSEQLANDRVLRVAIDLESSPVSYAEVFRRWQHDADFRSFFIALLADAPFSAFRWETPPVTAATADRPFEFVLLDSPGLARKPDPDAFAEHFSGAAKGGVVEFPNLGKDAIMVVPCPNDPLSAYGHLAAFVRQAPELQIHALWELVGAAMERRVGTAAVWLSTAGAGVSWLHIRLDDRPKYYGHTPYREAAKPRAAPDRAGL